MIDQSCTSQVTHRLHGSSRCNLYRTFKIPSTIPRLRIGVRSGSPDEAFIDVSKKVNRRFEARVPRGSRSASHWFTAPWIEYPSPTPRGIYYDVAESLEKTQSARSTDYSCGLLSLVSIYLQNGDQRCYQWTWKGDWHQGYHCGSGCVYTHYRPLDAQGYSIVVVAYAYLLD